MCFLTMANIQHRKGQLEGDTMRTHLQEELTYGTEEVKLSAFLVGEWE